MTKQLVPFSTKDLQQVGINSQLTTNDLLEVIAHDIFQKMTDEINSCNESARLLKNECKNILAPEFDQMKADLVASKLILAKEEVNTGYSKPNGDDWAGYIQGYNFDLTEKTNGLHIKIDHSDFSISLPRGKQAAVKMKITCDERDEESSEKIKGITTKITTTIRKEFEKVITIPTDRFRELEKQIKLHNKRVQSAYDMLPDNKIISVERFSREARVKMNKKILASQPAEFRKKISELFNIKL